MIKDMIGNFVQIELSTGTVLEGFLHKKDDLYLKLVEYDNNVVIITMEAINFIRIRMAERKKQLNEDIQKNIQENIPKEQNLQIAKIIKTPGTNDFSMQLPKSPTDDSGNMFPKFVRSTGKKE